MRLEFFIARRYLFSRKSTNVINIISAITVTGVAVGTMALVVVLSVFNGLESLITKRFNTFNCDLKIIPAEGKVFIPDSLKVEKLKKQSYFYLMSESIEENILVKYDQIHHPFVLKGVSPQFALMTGIDTMITDGAFALEYDNTPVCVIGIGVQAFLSVSTDMTHPLKIYAPNRKAGLSDDPETAFRKKDIYTTGVYAIDPEVDQFILTPISFARDLLDYPNEVSALEISLKPGCDAEAAEASVQEIFGRDFIVKNRYEQHELIFKIMKSEKLIVFLLLAFILAIASFNVIGSLTMLIIEKKKDIGIIRSMGLSIWDIRRIFLLEGWMISFLGTIVGMSAGVILCILQMEFGLIPMQGSTPGAFIVNAYPVEMYWPDFVLVFFTVLLIGYLAARFPVRYITRKYLAEERLFA